MEEFVRCVALALVAVILTLLTDKRSGELAALLSICACGLICAAAVGFWEPVVEFLDRLRELGSLDSTVVTVLLKAAGIGILAELVALVCNDAGRSAIGKAVQWLANAVILWLSLPLLNRMLAMLEEVLGTA